MKKLIVLFLILTTAFISCEDKVERERQREKQETDIAEERARVENVLDQYVIANENQDFSIIERIWAEEEGIAMIGTDSDELLTGWEQIKSAIQHQFLEFEDTYISVNDQKIRISESGEIAWFYETLNYNFIHNGKAMSFEGIRFTGVLKKTDGNWELVQGHLSIPAEVDMKK